MEIYLINTEGKHNKYWSAVLEPSTYSAIVKWGRLGTNGQTKTYKFNSIGLAENFIDKKSTEKFRKNYYEIDQYQLTKKQIKAKLMGSECKINELKFLDKLSSGLYVEANHDRLADPKYQPIIMCHFAIKGKNAHYFVLVSGNQVYTYNKEEKIWIWDKMGGTPHYQYKLGPLYEVDSDDPILNKIPNIIQAAFS